MKFILKNPRINIYNLLRGAGYHFQPPSSAHGSWSRGEDKKETAFCRVIGTSRSGYPRFHLYLKISEDNLIFNLHLDQKKPVYKGAPAHAAEYSGPVVEQESERIKKIFEQL